MVEAWMLFCLFMPFLEVVLQTHLQSWRESSNQEKEDSAVDIKQPGGKKIQVWRSGRLITLNVGGWSAQAEHAKVEPRERYKQ
jgi:hypothetical protein